MSDKIKCGFCKTEVEPDALVCPACGATHYYYTHDGEKNGYISYEAAEKQIKRVNRKPYMSYAKYPIIFFLISYVVYKTGGRLGPSEGFLILIWLVSGFVLFPASLLVFLSKWYSQRQVYDAPKRFWVEKPVANITHNHTTVYKS